MLQGVYRIKIKGQLDNSRAKWFEEWEITPVDDGTTILTSRMTDQSALHGVLTSIHNLNLPILSITRVESQ